MPLLPRTSAPDSRRLSQLARARLAQAVRHHDADPDRLSALRTAALIAYLSEWTEASLASHPEPLTPDAARLLLAALAVRIAAATGSRTHPEGTHPHDQA